MKFKILLMLSALVFAAASCNKQTQNMAAPTPAKTTPAEITQQEVIISDNGFEPKDLTVKKGSTITFVNQSGKPAWPASAPHPTHTDYSAFDPKKGIEVGATWSFTFDQTGEWGFHDHLSPFRRGTITVTD